MFNNKGNNNLNALRILAVEMINKANSGHPGIALGAAPMMYSLYAENLKVDPTHPQWFNRDRFVLSAGHGSALLYATLHLAGFDISIDDLKNFRQTGSKTPGHPELGISGVEATTGPLGQGIGIAVGMAVAEKFLSAKFNQPEFEIIDHFTYVLCGDGDLQEGVAQEAISFAGKNKLNKLILLHDSNDVQLDDFIASSQEENFIERFKAENWNSIRVEDGEDLEAISQAIQQAKKSDKPTYIEVKTIIGHGATKQGTPSVHGAPIGNDLNHVKETWDYQYEEFNVPEEVYQFYQEHTLKSGQQAYNQWSDLFKNYQHQFPELAKTLDQALKKNYQVDFDAMLNQIPTKPQATRVSSGLVLDNLTTKIPTMMGGSADLGGSTKVVGADGKFSEQNLIGRNIMFGVREFAMAAIANGLSLHEGILPFVSTFFVFSDYLKPALRLSALMEQQVLYIFTHDSVAVGEDGPTHQPVEQLAMIRSIPNVVLFRPCDYQEVVGAYHWAIKQGKKVPSVIVATRQDLVQLNHQNVIEQVARGGYLIQSVDQPRVSLIASGSEVSLALDVAKILASHHIEANVVSMVSTSLFDQQPLAYRQSVIRPDTFKVSLEMGTTFGWAKYTGDNGLNLGIDTFGASGPGEEVISQVGFDSQKISNQILKLVK